jgi:molybdenum cofactor cytidylyltransferase
VEPEARAPARAVRAVVLAAGAGRRFGGGKVLATLEGRPLIQHVLDALAEAGVDDPIVVLGRDAATVEAALPRGRATIVRNPEPERGLASSLQVGWAAALEAGAAAVLVALADQPRLSPAVVAALLALDLDPARPIAAPRYAGGGGRNPVRIDATADALVRGLRGDRGLRPLIVARPELVRSIGVPGSNPDVDRPEDLRAIAPPDPAA